MKILIHLRSDKVVCVDNLAYVRVFMKNGHEDAGDPKVSSDKIAENFYYPYADQYNFVGVTDSVIVKADDVLYLEITV